MTRFHDDLKSKMDEYVHFVYACTKKFPKEELYGVTSQFRRAALSVILNYIEGYARGRDKIHKNFLEISYGSLKESKYLLHFSLVENYLQQADYERAVKLAEEIGAMLWGMLRKM
ncbi:four helix bundle protein [Candidatus Peregrinibacteria bacterium]|nr:four helix bundle protein [Candidatus Peregrinibacteria bacterium]